ncbi:MAG: EFR1 family ferrodoxin [Spirochaetes bacterium]|nr:EFR1 family ferrodoxin [Spirochaetota bacterium]
MKKILIQYFSGTGNSLYVCENISEYFSSKNYSVKIECIVNEAVSYCIEDVECFGIVFPVYALDMPRIIRKHLKLLKPQQKISAFAIATMGAPDEEGWSLENAVKLLQKKNFDVKWTEAVVMPINWVAFSDPPEMTEAEQIILKSKASIMGIIKSIAENRISRKHFVMPRYGRLNSVMMYYGFKFGCKYLWKGFKTTDNCILCGKCINLCPVNAIQLKKKKIIWTDKCEQCMRCMNICPERAIIQYDVIGKGSKKNRYIFPEFIPEKIQKYEKSTY